MFGSLIGISNVTDHIGRLNVCLNKTIFTSSWSCFSGFKQVISLQKVNH